MTRKRRDPKTEKELAAELHAHRDDPGEWGETPVEAEISPQRGVLMSFRLSSVEFISMQKAAQASGESLSEFVRNAIALRLHGKPIPTSMQITSGANRSTFFTPVAEPGRTENPGPSIPDIPPQFAALTS